MSASFFVAIIGAIVVGLLVGYGISALPSPKEIVRAVSSELRDLPTDRDLELAALYNLDPPFVSEFFPKPDAELDYIQTWINEKRAWVATLEDRRVQMAYAGWLDYTQKKVHRSRRENLTHAEANRNKKIRVEMAEEWKRGKDAADTIPKPPVGQR